MADPVACRLATWAIAVQARKRSGLPSQEIASKAGIESQRLADIEAAIVVPSIDELTAIVDACGLELRLVVAPRDAQRETRFAAARERSIEERIEANVAAGKLVRELHRG